MIWATLIIFMVFILVMALVFKKSQKMKISEFTINGNTKDKNISYNHYMNDIEEFLFLMYYTKEIQDSNFIYSPRSVHSMFTGKNLVIDYNTYYIHIQGPSNIIKILANRIETPQSNFISSIKYIKNDSYPFNKVGE